jgi:hypothetical protein
MAAEGRLTGMLTFSNTNEWTTPLESFEVYVVMKIKVGKY